MTQLIIKQSTLSGSLGLVFIAKTLMKFLCGHPKHGHQRQMGWVKLTIFN